MTGGVCGAWFALGVSRCRVTAALAAASTAELRGVEEVLVVRGSHWA